MGHKHLLRKLSHYGTKDLPLTWLEDWLMGRTQHVVVEGQCSEEAPVTSGVPQGTVLGHLMFILYINDINSDTCSSIRLFADDCLLYRVVECTRDAAKLQSDLMQLWRWAKDWQMDFNALINATSSLSPGGINLFCFHIPSPAPTWTCPSPPLPWCKAILWP